MLIYFDLSQTPVKIILNEVDGDGLYQFIYSKNSEILEEKMLFVKKGNYTYTIESDKLLFTSTSGNLTIDEQNRGFTFSYSVNVEDGDDVEERLFNFEVAHTLNTYSQPSVYSEISFVLSTSMKKVFNYYNVETLVINIHVYEINTQHTEVVSGYYNFELSNVGSVENIATKLLSKNTNYHLALHVLNPANNDILQFFGCDFNFEPGYINTFEISSSVNN